MWSVSTANSKGNYAFPRTGRGSGYFCEPWIGFLAGSVIDPKIRNHSALPKSLIVENTLAASDKNGLPPRNAVLEIEFTAMAGRSRRNPAKDTTKDTAVNKSSSNCASGLRR